MSQLLFETSLFIVPFCSREDSKVYPFCTRYMESHVDLNIVDATTLFLSMTLEMS